MENKIYTQSLVVLDTITNKTENQDYSAQWSSESFRSLIVADGLGSFKYPRLSAEKVVGYFLETISASEDGISFATIHDLYKRVKQKLIDFSFNFPEEKDCPDYFGTTAITLFETSEKIIIAYTGNGAIWHIRGNFSEFLPSFKFPWNAINYLNPHTVPEKGKEVLYRLITDNSDFNECFPTIIEIEKDKLVGDIFMICTDGIYSADQLVTGENNQGTWVKYEETMLTFFKRLALYFKNNHPYNTENSKEHLQQYLETIRASLNDDATIGVLITKETLNYQRDINGVEAHENNTGYKI